MLLHCNSMIFYGALVWVILKLYTQETMRTDDWAARKTSLSSDLLTSLCLLCYMFVFVCVRVCVCGGGGVGEHTNVLGLSLDYCGILIWYADSLTGRVCGWTFRDYSWISTISLVSVDTLSEGYAKGGHPACPQLLWNSLILWQRGMWLGIPVLYPWTSTVPLSHTDILAEG